MASIIDFSVSKSVQGAKITRPAFRSKPTLPSFEDLLKGAENFCKRDNGDKGYSETSVSDFSGQSPSFSFSSVEVSGSQESPETRTTGDRRRSSNFNSEDLSFDTLISVGTSDYYSSFESPKKKEEDILAFMALFLKTHRFLGECFEKMNLELSRYEMDFKYLESSQDYLYTTCLENQKIVISRKDFIKWMVEIPDIMYTNVISTLEKLSKCLYELKIMKSNWAMQQDSLRQKNKTSVQISSLGKPNEEICDEQKNNPIQHFNRNVESRSSSLNASRIYNKLSKKSHRVAKRSNFRKSNNCKHCETDETPEWRRGPDGSRTLCNACGLFFSKLIKRFNIDDAVIIMNYRKNKRLTKDRTVPSLRNFQVEICELSDV